MADAAPNPGRNVYGRSGERAEYVASIAGAHLVRPIMRYTQYDGEEFEEPSDALVIWAEVYPKAPVVVADEEVKRLQAEVADARKALNEERREIATVQREHLDTLQRLKRFAPLANLEPILNGEITHVVERGCFGVKIREFREALVYRDDYERKDVMRMLSLRPTKDGEIAWHLTSYSDGSGSAAHVVLCTSLDQAREAATVMLLGFLEGKSPDKEGHMWASVAKSADALGLPLPPDVADVVHAFHMKVAQAAVDKATEALSEAEAKLAETARAPSPTPSEGTV